MAEPTLPNVAEAPAVQLTRMEGKLDLVAFQIADHGKRLDTHEALITSLTLTVQRLSDQAVARDATVVTTAAALKDAEEARRDKDTQGWTPAQRAFAVLGAAAVIFALITQYLPGG